MVEIIPAILTLDKAELEEKIILLEGITQRVQIDIVDGKFANNKTIEPDVLGEIDTNLKIDFHLMCKEPSDWIESCIRGMADRIIGQIEMMNDQVEFVGRVQEAGLLVGLAVDIETPISDIDPVILTNLDVVLVMSVKAGFGGQPFDKRALDKIKELDEIRIQDSTPFRICVDGGINESNIVEVRRAGADEVAIGEHLFKEDLSTHIKKLQRASHEKE